MSAHLTPLDGWPNDPPPRRPALRLGCADPRLLAGGIERALTEVGFTVVARDGDDVTLRRRRMAAWVLAVAGHGDLRTTTVRVLPSGRGRGGAVDVLVEPGTRGRADADGVITALNLACLAAAGRGVAVDIGEWRRG